jgi:hypothetical protein
VESGIHAPKFVDSGGRLAMQYTVGPLKAPDSRRIWNNVKHTASLQVSNIGFPSQLLVAGSPAFVKMSPSEVGAREFQGDALNSGFYFVPSDLGHLPAQRI